LFPGYLFLQGTEQSRLTALQTNKVVTTLNVNDQDQLQSELHALHQAVCSGNEVKAEPQIEEGDRVEVVHGSLVGLRGYVSRCDGLTRIIIVVKMLGRGISIQVEDWMLQKI
jgi:transcription antitermination factor NusG